MVVRDLSDAAAGQRRHPYSVVENLCDDIAGRLVAFQFEDLKVALSVNGEQVDELAVWRTHLPPDHEQARAQQ